MPNPDQPDRLDLSILRVLGAEGRISWRELAEKVGLSLTPVLRRVKRLEEQGIIQGYGVRVDEARLSGAITVFINVTLDRQAKDVLDPFEARIATFPEIRHAHLMSGASDYLLQANVRDLDHYRQLLERLTDLRHIAHVQSSFALKSVPMRG